MPSISHWQHRFFPALAPLGRVWAVGMGLRRSAYLRGVFKRFKPPCPCVSVGNISWGGSGKTPVTDWLLGWASATGRKAVVLSRGYKAHPPSLPYLVQPDSPTAQAGDEPLMLALSRPEAHVVVDPVRARGASWAWEHLHPELFILDDGFQHLAVERQTDLVLLRPEDIEDEWDRTQPAGSWREGREALERASAFLIKASPERFSGLENRIRERLFPLGKPVFSFVLHPVGLRRVRDNESVERGSEFPPYVLVTAVADLAQAAATFEGFLGRPPERHFAYPDHHGFSASDWRDISSVASDGGVEHILCTAKDAVKLRTFADDRLISLDVEASFGPALYSGVSFLAWWEATWFEMSSQFRGV